MTPNAWTHDPTFDQDQRWPGESRTLIVIALTALTMVVEVVTGWLFGSMALLADGLHMGSHAVALTISAVAYDYARKRAGDLQFSFAQVRSTHWAGSPARSCWPASGCSWLASRSIASSSRCRSRSIPPFSSLSSALSSTACPSSSSATTVIVASYEVYRKILGGCSPAGANTRRTCSFSSGGF